jgi:hypothetical protein
MRYSSDRQFRIWDYTVSHSTLFLRSNVFEEYEDGRNIKNDTVDIEFWAVSYIELPDSLEGLELGLVTNGIPDRLSELLKYDLKLFELKTKHRTGYVIAGGCVVGKSTWDHNKGRFENFKLDYPEILVTL